MTHCEYCGTEETHKPFTENETTCPNDKCPLSKRWHKIMKSTDDGYPLDKADYPPMPPKKYTTTGELK